MAIAEVTATVGENEYTLSNSTEDTYEIDVASPLTTSAVEVVAEDDAGNMTTDNSQVLRVIGEWSSPKVDWSDKWNGSSYVGDYFTYVDYNRIKNNVLFLIGYASKMYNVTSTDMGDDKEETSIPYADEFNAIEDAISTLCAETYNLDFTENTWYENKNTPTADDLNRIEGMQLKLYEMLVAQRNAQNRLAFTLGGQKGFKV